MTYAKAHWKDKDGSLCAEFVSDCLKAGGCGAYSEGCTTLLNRLESGKYGRITQLTMSGNGRLPVSDNSGKVSPGDPIFWYCPNHDHPYVHVVLCGGTSGKYVTAYAHNAPKNNEVVTANKCGYCGGKIQAVYAFQMSGKALSGKPDDGIKTGVWCNLINVGSGKYLNVYGSSAKNSANIDVYERDGTSGEKFMFTYTSSGWYTITPACAVSRRVNVYGTSAKQGPMSVHELPPATALKAGSSRECPAVTSFALLTTPLSY